MPHCESETLSMSQFPSLIIKDIGPLFVLCFCIHMYSFPA